MLSLDLFNTHYEKKLHEGAVDDAEYARLKKLGEKIDYLKQARAKTTDPEMRRAIDGRIEQYDNERREILSVRGMKEAEQPTQRPSKQDAFAYVKPEPRGIGDIQDPRTKMASLAQKAKKGPLANVGAGLRGFLTGKEEPIDEQEQEQPQLGRRGIGMANMKALQATVEKGFARTIFQFPNIKYVVGEDDTDKMADYYNALDSAGRTNFVYNVLGDGMKFVQMCKELGITADPVEPKQPELPGITPQGELPLSERQGQKKKSEDDITTGDVKTAREIQKIRAQYPAARSDVEALARAEIDSTERSQQQIGNLRSANSKQDELLKQIMDLDREQSKEIDSLDNENDSLEQQLARVQGLNDKLTQTVAQMVATPRTVTKTTQRQAQKAAPATIDLIPGAPADQVQAGTTQAVAKPEPGADQIKPTKPAAPISPGAKVIQLPKFSPPERLVKAAKVSGSDITEGAPQEAIRRYLAIDAETDVEAVKKAIHAISKDPALSANSKTRLLGYMFALVNKHRLPMGRAYYQFLRQYMEEGWSDRYNPTPYAVYIDGRQWKEFRSDDEARAVADKVRANLKRQGRDQQVTIGPSQAWLSKGVKEAKEILTRDDFVRERDRLLRMISQETNPANKQILKSAIRQLESRAENEGWISIQQRMVREESSTSSEEAESAILKRIMVAHLDLLKEYGPQKVMQAVEEVAYNVGDLPEIGSSDVSGWVEQVKQILGVPEDPYYDDADEFGMPGSEFFPDEKLDEKWSAKYKRSINCANPKGFSQRAHCQGRKKK